MERNMHDEQQIDLSAWWWMAPLGLTIIGFGLSLTGQAIIAKSKGKSFWHWFGLGTLGLTVLNSGVSIFGDAVKRRTLLALRARETTTL
ncbi:MAG: hypothetical protein RML95_05965 [Anaerolineae bacterium]|nr:hypothetical protein [Anaerolineae bacterium]